VCITYVFPFRHLALKPMSTTRPGRARRPLGIESSDLFGVKAASSCHSVPGRRGLYVATWAYVSGWTFWCCRLLEGSFPP
jgi:hypothetical protein